MTTRFALFDFAGLRCRAALGRRRAPRPRRHRTSRRRRRSDADDPPGDDDVLRRHWAVVCADRRGARQRQVVGERLPPRHQLDPGLHQRRRLRRHVRRTASKDRAEIFGSFLVDTRIDRDIRPLFVNDPTFGGVIDRYPRVNQYVDRRQRRRFLRRREVQPLVRVPPEPGGDRAARHGQAADRQDRRGRQHRQGGLLDRSASSARKPRSWSKSRVTAATSCAAARTASTRRPARSAGAPASPSRRATSCGSSAS